MVYLLCAQSDFNPRIREGCDSAKYIKIMDQKDFNPRIREGCDEIRSWQIWTELNFNPHIREGCDINPCIYFMVPAILIHASARDATAKSYKIGSDFSALFRKFIQKLGIVTFRISIF